MFRYLLLLVALLSFGQSNAQTTDQNYPVTAQAFVVAQPNQKLAAYFASNKALTVSLLLKDLTKTSIQVFLRWSIDGPGVHLSSMDGHIPAHFITLQRGMMQRISGLDLQSDYFLPGPGNCPQRSWADHAGQGCGRYQRPRQSGAGAAG